MPRGVNFFGSFDWSLDSVRSCSPFPPLRNPVFHLVDFYLSLYLLRGFLGSVEEREGRRREVRTKWEGVVFSALFCCRCLRLHFVGGTNGVVLQTKKTTKIPVQRMNELTRIRQT